MNAREGFRRIFRIAAWLITVPAFALYLAASWPQELDVEYWSAVLRESEQLDFDPTRSFQLLPEPSVSLDAAIGLGCAKARDNPKSANARDACNAIEAEQKERKREIALHILIAGVIASIAMVAVLAVGRVFDWVLAGFQGAG